MKLIDTGKKVCCSVIVLLGLVFCSSASAANSCSFWNLKDSADQARTIGLHLSQASVAYGRHDITNGDSKANTALDEANQLKAALNNIQAQASNSGEHVLRRFELTSQYAELAVSLATNMTRHSDDPPVDVTSFLGNWEAYLGKAYDVYASTDSSGPGYANHLLTASKTFTDIYLYLDTAALEQYRSGLDQITTFETSKDSAVNDYLSTTAQVAIHIRDGVPISKAYARGSIYNSVNRSRLRTSQFENPESLSEIIQAVREPNSTASVWGEVVGSNFIRIKKRIVNGVPTGDVMALEFANWIEQKYYLGNDLVLHPITKQSIIQQARFMSIDLRASTEVVDDASGTEDFSDDNGPTLLFPDGDGAGLMGTTPVQSHVPGVHAEIFVYNELLNLLNSNFPQFFDQQGFILPGQHENVVRMLSIITLGENGQPFRACLNCSGIIDPNIILLTGFKWSNNVM